MRKVWITFAVIGALLAGLALILSFKALTEGIAKVWCLSVAGIGGGGLVANVVTKKITGG